MSAGGPTTFVPLATWQAASGEDTRALLQTRLITLSKVLLGAFCALLVFFSAQYAAYPWITPRLTPQIFAGAAVGLAVMAALWQVMRRRALALGTLSWIDATYMFGIGVEFACSAVFAPELHAAAYTSIIQVILVVFTRAMVVPSTAWRTAAMSALALAPLIAGAVALVATTDQDVPDPVYVLACVTLSAAAVALASQGSRVLYGLERRAGVATQLGQYTLEDKIGSGGMGEVYRAHHVLLRRPTAIKLVRPDRIGAETLDRFEREVRHTSELTHPNTVAVFDYGRSHDGVFYYAMEYLAGIDLDRLVREHGAQPSARVVAILVQVCGALQEAHDRGIVHRDIKPGNIILCERGGLPDVAKVVDFGIAKQITDDAATTTQNLIGTPAYLAPEVITDGRAGPASDLYALGAVAYFLLAGRPAFAGATSIATCLLQVTARPAPLAGVDPALATIVMRCLAKGPGERYASAAALAEALAALRCADWDEDRARTWWLTTPIVTRHQPTDRTITIDLGRRA